MPLIGQGHHFCRCRRGEAIAMVAAAAANARVNFRFISILQFFPAPYRLCPHKREARPFYQKTDSELIRI
jgi:hypothetical protein